MTVIEALATLVTGIDFTTSCDKLSASIQCLYEEVRLFLGRAAASPRSPRPDPILRKPSEVEVAESFRRTDVIETIKPLRSSCQKQSDPIEGLYDLIGLFFRRAAVSPASPGYEPMLVKLNVAPFVARQLAYLLARRGHQSAADSARHPAVVRAIRFLAKPGRRSQAILRKATVLLAAWQETSVVETIFDDAGLNEFEFIKLLELAIGGNKTVHGRICAIAGTIAPRLSVPRGRKISAASAAHEFLLEECGSIMKSKGYTWDPSNEDFTDPWTQATRIEFGDPDFDPRPASRRVKARQRPKKTIAGGG
jgi:hypothetical protein